MRALPHTLLAALTLAACSSDPTGASGSGGTSGTPSQTELGDGTVGSSCGTCQADLQCVGGQVPGGYCTKACSTAGECGGSGRCVQTNNGGVCFRSCNTDWDCRPGYACKSAGSVGSVCDVWAPANTGGSGGSGGTSATSGCDAVIVPEVPGNGCAIRLVTPQRCEEVDLTNGRTYEFAWTTDGTWCETPYKLYIVGNPPSESNAVVWSYSTTYENGMITHNGGLDRISAADLQAVTSTDGIYHWVVVGFHGSHPASVAFRIKQ
ncbi:MAG: hypothetical protein HY898_10230 [Deltaproteobacteria bacterium]|nr:hypothetical protein [Deltaproteobacteria bacterium]